MNGNNSIQVANLIADRAGGSAIGDDERRVIVVGKVDRLPVEALERIALQVYKDSLGMEDWRAEWFRRGAMSFLIGMSQELLVDPRMVIEMKGLLGGDK